MRLHVPCWTFTSKLIPTRSAGANPLLPVLLPEGAQQYAAPAPEATAADAYEAADWVAEAGLPAQRLAGYRLRLGLPGVFATPDPATTPHFGQRAGYYLQQRSSNGSWKDLYFFRLDEFLAQDFALVRRRCGSNTGFADATTERTAALSTPHLMPGCMPARMPAPPLAVMLIALTPCCSVRRPTTTLRAIHSRTSAKTWWWRGRRPRGA